MKKLPATLIAIVCIGGISWLFLSESYLRREKISWEEQALSTPIPAEVSPSSEPEAPAPPPRAVEIVTALFDEVPFTAQAPYGKWSQPYKDACEEASILMVASFLRSSELTLEIADKEIRALADFSERKFGQFVDASAEDTALMLEEYYGVPSEVVYDMKLEDMRRAVVEGNLLIVPANGRKLGNPNFTPPGPVNHMLVVIGYDAVTKEFVTNDPGTRRGQGYRYGEDVLYTAIRDYPTGNHLPNLAERKAMIVVEARP